MIVVVDYSSPDDYYAVVGFLRNRFGFRPLTLQQWMDEPDTFIANANRDFILSAEFEGRVAPTLTASGVQPIFVRRAGAESRGPAGTIVVTNEGTVDNLQAQLVEAVATASSRHNQASAGVRAGLNIPDDFVMDKEAFVGSRPNPN